MHSSTKAGWITYTVRDHVVFDEQDKREFLENHPLQKFYGGENAFTPAEYRKAIEGAGGKIKKEFKYYDSVINYYPQSVELLDEQKKEYLEKIKNRFHKRIGLLRNIPFVFELYKVIKPIDLSKALDERRVPGRMYTYIATKE